MSSSYSNSVDIIPSLEDLPDITEPGVSKDTETKLSESLAMVEKIPDVTRTPLLEEETSATSIIQTPTSSTEMTVTGPTAAANHLKVMEMQAMASILNTLAEVVPATLGAVDAANQLVNGAQLFVNEFTKVLQSSPIQNGLVIESSLATPFGVNPRTKYQSITESTIQRLHTTLHPQVLSSAATGTTAQLRIPVEETSLQSKSTESSAYPGVAAGLLYGAQRDSVKRVTISEEDKAQLLKKAQEPPKYSKSVTQQNEKVLSIYQTFTHEMNIPSFPLTAISVVSFLMWLASTKRYCPRTLDDIVFPSLCRLEILHSHQYVDPYVSSCARATIAELYRNTDLKQSGEGMIPIIPDDVSRIIQAMPRQASSTAKWASLFLVALATGARGSTCSHIRLCDLIHLREGEKGIQLLGVNLVRLKSRPGEVFEITLAGYPDTYSPMDVLYWLNRYLKQSFGVSLEILSSSQNTIPPEKLNRKLWPLTTDSMREALKRKMEDAGLNSKGYGFHSFRSGFLAACLTVGSSKGLSLEDILIRSALLAGWKPKGDVHIGYVKTDTRANLIATNEVGLTDTPSRTKPPTFAPPASLSEKDSKGNYPISNSIEFHRAAPQNLPPLRRQRSFASEVLHVLQVQLHVPVASDAANYAYASQCYTSGLIHFAREKLGDDAILMRNPALRKEGLRIVDARLQEDPDCAETIASEIIAYLKEKGKLKTQLREPLHCQKYKCRGPERGVLPTLHGGIQRKRVEWSAEEEEIFRDGVEHQLSYRDIADKLYIRTPEDVRFHLRKVNKIRAQQSPPLPPLILPRSKPRKPKEEGALSPATTLKPMTSDAASSRPHRTILYDDIDSSTSCSSDSDIFPSLLSSSSAKTDSSSTSSDFTSSTSSTSST